ncbi:MAG: Sjogren's syndrome/scleroderma autoantigen 1 family protein [Promethearchaeota archaeon]
MRKGATMLNEACPECSGPLFQLKDDIICPHCGKKVLIVQSDAEVFEIEKDAILSELDQAISGQIENLKRRLEKENDIDELNQLGRLILLYLEALEKLKRIRS